MRIPVKANCHYVMGWRYLAEANNLPLIVNPSLQTHISHRPQLQDLYLSHTTYSQQLSLPLVENVMRLRQHIKSVQQYKILS